MLCWFRARYHTINGICFSSVSGRDLLLWEISALAAGRQCPSRDLVQARRAMLGSGLLTNNLPMLIVKSVAEGVSPLLHPSGDPVQSVHGMFRGSSLDLHTDKESPKQVQYRCQCTHASLPCLRCCCETFTYLPSSHLGPSRYNSRVSF